MKRRDHRAFTLMELMMVVAILGVLVSVALPKFVNLILKAHEAGVKGSLGSIRSAVTTYYSDNEGIFPSPGNLKSSLEGRYVDIFPTCKVPEPANHLPTNGVTDFAGAYTDVGDWMYFPSTGAVAVNCTHSDSIARVWNTN